MSTTPYDLIVIGSGPAGYVGAIRAAQLGKRVAIIEKERAGGTCLNWGCIPTKALLKNAELYSMIGHHASDFGLEVSGLRYDWEKVIGRSRKVADKLAGGIEFLLKRNKITHIKGEASILQADLVEFQNSDGKKDTLSTSKILIATGVTTREMPGFPFNATSVIGSRHALLIDAPPKELLIIGAGAIGIEFAYFFNAFGTKVTILEMQANILPLEDTEISAMLEKSLSKQGIRILTGTKVEKATATQDQVTITVSGNTNETISADVSLVAIGVSPLLPSSATPFTLDAKGYLAVNDRYETSIPGIYAAGDIIGPPLLAHVASWEAIQSVEGMFDKRIPARKRAFPSCTYCQPQVASIGLTEREAKAKGLTVKIGKFPFQASGKALAVGEAEGFVKLIFNEPHHELIGAHIIGSDATEMIAEMGLAITLEATYDDIVSTIHAHPTLSEAIFEATEAAFGHAIHI